MPVFCPIASVFIRLLCPSQTEPLQQEVREEVPDCGRALQGAAAHRFLPQDGNETRHRAGGERRGSQSAFCDAFHCVHAVSAEYTRSVSRQQPHSGVSRPAVR